MRQYGSGYATSGIKQRRSDHVNLKWMTFVGSIGFAVAAFCMPQKASATITINSENADVNASGTDFFNFFGGQSQDISDSSLFTSFNHTIQLTVPGHAGVELDDSATQDTEITQDGDTLNITSSGSFSFNHKSPDPSERRNLISNAGSSMSIIFTIDQPYTFSASASGQIQAPSGKYKSFPFFSGFAGVTLPANNGAFGTGLIVISTINTDQPDAASGSTGQSATLLPGQYEVSVSIDANPFNSPLTCKNNSGVCDEDLTASKENPPSASGSYQLQFNLSPAPPPGTVFPWIGPSGGGFGNQANWQPDNGIPTFVDGSESDTALFQNLGILTVDLNSSAASAQAPRRISSSSTFAPQCAGVITRSVGNMNVDNVKSLEPINGSLQLDSLSFDQPSLAVLNGGLLELDQSALCAEHAVIGQTGQISTVDVNTNGFLQTLGRLSIGQGGIGALDVSNQGVAESQEVRLGDGSLQGSADISNATWTTDNIAVGFQSTGELKIENAGLVNSQQGFVAFQLPGGPDPGLGQTGSQCLGRKGTAGGVDVIGANSTWTFAELFVGPLGCVEVTNNGLLNAISISGVGSGQVVLGADDSGNPHLLVNNGGVLTTADNLVVGDGGGADFTITATGGSHATVGQSLVIGNGGSTATFGPGVATVIGDPSINSTTLSSNNVEIGEIDGSGQLKASSNAQINTTTTAQVGVDGFGLVNLGSGDASDTTAWTIGTSLTLGGASPSGTGILLDSSGKLDIGSSGSPGTFTINQFGSLLNNSSQASALTPIISLHNGTVTNNGRIEGPFQFDLGNYDGSSTGTISGRLFGVLVPAAAAATRKAGATKSSTTGPQGPTVFGGNADFTNTTLELDFRNGFAPKQGDSFQMVQVSGTATGSFANVQIDGLAPGASFSVDPVSGMATALNDTVALPVVTIKGPKKLKESKKAGSKLTFTRKGDTSTDVTVSYSISGTAVNGVDYATLPGTIVIPAKKKSATVSIIPYNDGAFEPNETIEVEILPGSGYSVGSKSDVTVSLTNVDPKIKKSKK